jgi:hypothetical protein
VEEEEEEPAFSCWPMAWMRRLACSDIVQRLADYSMLTRNGSTRVWGRCCRPASPVVYRLGDRAKGRRETQLLTMRWLAYMHGVEEDPRMLELGIDRVECRGSRVYLLLLSNCAGSGSHH